MWEKFGFTQNPYDHLPIAANEVGERLLVGRTSEISQLTDRITARNAIPTLEGDIGVGKTSIISVAAYKLERAFFEKGGACYLALERPFQLASDDTVDKFTNTLYQEILKKLHSRRSALIDSGINVGETEKLYNWLTSEQYSGVSGGLGGFSIGVNTAPNTGSGFSQSGFQTSVDAILKSTFPNPKKGGIICVIDNLELLEKSTKARTMLEAMRDGILSAHGIIWVVCGARGIVRGVASSPRLQAHLSKPMQITAINQASIEDLIERRVKEYREKPGAELAPVDQQGFLHLFKIFKENLRTSLKFCADFAEWLNYTQNINKPAIEKFELLQAWLTEEADDFRKNINITPKPWEIFDKIVDLGGAVAPSDHEKFGYDSQMALRPQIKSLEEAGLVDSTIDETDQRRRTISVTPKGWLVNYSRRGYPE